MIRALAAVTLILPALVLSSPGFAAAPARGSASEASQIERLRQGGDVAREAARSLGTMESAAGLRAVIATGDADLADHYARGFPGDYGASPEFPFLDEHLSPEVEAVIVATLSDDALSSQIREAAVDLIDDRLYRSRALFDRLLVLARASDWRLRGSGLAAITRTRQPGIEDAVVRLYAETQDDRRYLLLPLFEQRHVAGALPHLRKAVAARPVAKGRGYHEYRIIAALGTAEAASFLVDELSQYRDVALDETAERSLLLLLGSLAAVPPDTPMPMGRVIGKVPHAGDPDVLRAYAALLVARKDPAAVEPLVQVFGTDPYQWHEAQGTLMAMDTPEAWRRIEAAVKQYIDVGSPRQSQAKFLQQEMRKRLADPSEFRAQREQRRAREAAGRKQRELQAAYGDKLRELEERDPAKFAEAQAQYQRLLEQADFEEAEVRPEKLREIAGGHDRSARRLRFTDRKPAEAVAEMQQALELGRRLEKPSDLDSLERLVWLADTWRFDLGNKDKALEHYRAALEILRRRPRLEGGKTFHEGFNYWLPHEIRYLETGQAFSGAVGYDEVSAVGHTLFVLSPWSWRDGDEGARLEDVPRSQFMLSHERLLQGQPSAAEILRFLERRDPARYLSAVLFAQLAYGGKDEDTSPAQKLLRPRGARQPAPDLGALLAASEQFRRRHRIAFVAYAETSRASPPQTWRLLLTALREQDLDTALSCFTPRSAEAARSVLASVPARELTRYAYRLEGLVDPERTEQAHTYTVLIEQTEPKLPLDRSTRIRFEPAGSRWLVADAGFLPVLKALAHDEQYERTRARTCSAAAECPPGARIYEIADRFTRAYLEGDRLVVHYTNRREITDRAGQKTAGRVTTGCSAVNLKEMGFFPLADNTVYSWGGTPYVQSCDPSAPAPATATELPIHALPEPTATAPAAPMEQQRHDHAFLRSAAASAPLVLAHARREHGPAGLMVVRRSRKDPAQFEFFQLYVPWTNLYIR